MDEPTVLPRQAVGGTAVQKMGQTDHKSLKASSTRMPVVQCLFYICPCHVTTFFLAFYMAGAGMAGTWVDVLE